MVYRFSNKDHKFILIKKLKTSGNVKIQSEKKNQHFSFDIKRGNILILKITVVQW